MSKRHRDALAISQGATNISGMSHALIDACKECIDSNTPMHTDAAVKLIVSQIAYIAGIWNGVSDFAKGDNFHKITQECERLKEPQTLGELLQEPPRTTLGELMKE